MVKVESGLFNELRGTLNKSRTTFQTRKTGIVAEKKPIPPPDPRGRRECIRTIYRMLCDKWNTLSEQEKQQYDETAEKHNITLFNAFLKEELTPRLWKCKLAKLDGQVLYLPFVEGEGNTVKDFSGFNNDGIIYGATWEKLSNNVNVLTFDGVDDYIGVNDSDSLDITDEITIMSYVNIDADITQNSMIVAKRNPEASTYEPYRLSILTDKRISAALAISNTERYISQSPPDTIEFSIWNFVAFTWSRSDGYGKIYVNGNLVHQEYMTQSELIKTTGKLLIGQRWTGFANLKGKMAFVAISNKRLTDNEIKKINDIVKQY